MLVPTLHRVVAKTERKPDDFFCPGEREKHAEESREKGAKERLSWKKSTLTSRSTGEGPERCLQTLVILLLLKLSQAQQNASSQTELWRSQLLVFRPLSAYMQICLIVTGLGTPLPFARPVSCQSIIAYAGPACGTVVLHTLSRPSQAPTLLILLGSRPCVWHINPPAPSQSTACYYDNPFTSLSTPYVANGHWPFTVRVC